MTARTLSDDEWDAWTDAKIEAVLSAAREELGAAHPDYSSVLNAVGNALVDESRRSGGGGGGGRHLHSID